jgi:hypothetical protein
VALRIEGYKKSSSPHMIEKAYAGSIDASAFRHVGAGE